MIHYKNATDASHESWVYLSHLAVLLCLGFQTGHDPLVPDVSGCLAMGGRVRVKTQERLAQPRSVRHNWPLPDVFWHPPPGLQTPEMEQTCNCLCSPNEAVSFLCKYDISLMLLNVHKKEHLIESHCACRGPKPSSPHLRHCVILNARLTWAVHPHQARKHFADPWLNPFVFTRYKHGNPTRQKAAGKWLSKKRGGGGGLN